MSVQSALVKAAMQRSKEAQAERDKVRLAKGREVEEEIERKTMAKKNGMRRKLAQDALREAILRSDDDASADMVEAIDADILTSFHDDTVGETPLHAAISRGLKKTIDAMLKKTNLDMVAAMGPDNHGRTPLHRAAATDDRKLCATIADISTCDHGAQDDHGRSALEVAQFWGLSDAAEVIHKAMEARRDVVGKFRATAREGRLVAAGKDAATLAALALAEALEKGQDLGHHAGIDALHAGKIDDALLLAKDECWPFVNEVDAKGRTMLHLAAMRGFEELAASLLVREEFEMADAYDQDRATALHLAASNRHSETVRAMIASGRIMLVNAGDLSGRTALHLAALRGDEESYEAILAHEDVAPDLPDSRGKTATQYAMERNMDVSHMYPSITDNDIDL